MHASNDVQDVFTENNKTAFIWCVAGSKGKHNKVTWKFHGSMGERQQRWKGNRQVEEFNNEASSLFESKHNIPGKSYINTLKIPSPVIKWKLLWHLINFGTVNLVKMMNILEAQQGNFIFINLHRINLKNGRSDWGWVLWMLLEMFRMSTTYFSKSWVRAIKGSKYCRCATFSKFHVQQLFKRKKS